MRRGPAHAAGLCLRSVPVSRGWDPCHHGLGSAARTGQRSPLAGFRSEQILAALLLTLEPCREAGAAPPYRRVTGGSRTPADLPRVTV